MISIVIPTCKEKNLLPCLESIKQYTDMDQVEVIAVCNGYDGLPPLCKSIYHPKKMGYPKAVNLGIKEAKGEFIVLLNDDTVLLPQDKNCWIDTLLLPFQDESVGITGPWMMRNTEIEQDFLCFFVCMIRKSVLDKIGLLDEAFGAGYAEDVDLCCRAVASGYRIVQVPDDGKVPYDGRFGYGAFPIYHQGNDTFMNWPGGQELLAKNHAILRERYAPVKIDNAQKLGEWMSDDELRWLGTQARKSKVVIELGSWFGKSSTAIADNLPEDGHLYCIDTWAGSAAEKDTNHIQARDMDGDYAYNEFARNLWRHIETGKLKPIRMHGRHASKLLQNMGVKADFIFIDAGHTKEEVKEDIYSFAPLLKNGGIISGHDYGINTIAGFEPWPGVSEAVNEVFGGNFGVNPSTSIWSTDYNPVHYIYECIMFGNELNMLEHHLDTMWPVVDRFIITEAIVTHAGKPKPSNFHANRERFKKYLSKITYLFVDDCPEMNGSEDSAWAIERHQREASMRGLTDCRDNDIIVVVDCDEIPNPDSVKNFDGELAALRMDLFLYDYKVKAKDPWRHGKIMRYGKLKLLGPNVIRYMSDVPDVVPGGEHLSYFGGVDSIIEKMHNTAHRNIDTPVYTDRKHIERCIANGLDLFGRDIQYEVCKLP